MCPQADTGQDAKLQIFSHLDEFYVLHYVIILCGKLVLD